MLINRSRYDVVIVGGGLAGLCLALQLEGRRPGIRVLVAEKSTFPQREAAHKVGESSVEVASHYFSNVLGLGDLLDEELPKFGLRFFMSNGDNDDIATRLECGPSHYLYVPSFQIDRGSFENALAERVRKAGVDLVDGCRVGSVTLAGDEEDHVVRLESAADEIDVACRWVVDASGRASLLKKTLDLASRSRHDVNAAWFRLDSAIDLDEWSAETQWRSRLCETRRLSTNHLMGPGYWVWLIPLANDRTSIGIVADARLHLFSELSSFDRALEWLERHEPQCARVVKSQLDRRMDFLALKKYAHDVKQVFSRRRWCLTGDSGLFIDPLYSPGSDFIAMANGFASDLIVRDLVGESVGDLAESYDEAYRSFARTFLVTYHRQYPLMGNSRVMTIKVIWDFVMYWGGIAPLFCRDKLQDAAFMGRIRPQLQGFAASNVRMQAFFRKWDAVSESDPEQPSRAFVDYAEISFLAELNRELLLQDNDDGLLGRLDQNLQLARDLQLEIMAEASRINEALPRTPVRSESEHLAEVFLRLRPEVS